MLQFAIYADTMLTTATFLVQVAGLEDQDLKRITASMSPDLAQARGIRSIFSLAEDNKEEVIKRIVSSGGMVVSSNDKEHQWIVTSTTTKGTIIGFMFD
jgi:hypothetical protein